MISTDTVQADYKTREANAARQTSKHSDECFLCGRGLTDSAVEKGWMIRLTTTGYLAPHDADLDVTLDQGCFPVGSECAKKVPAAYRTRF